MSLMPEDAPQDTQPPSSALTEEGARQALLEWLGQPDAPLTSLGRSEDGTAYRFQTEDGALYSVPLDGSPITAEPSCPAHAAGVTGRVFLFGCGTLSLSPRSAPAPSLSPSGHSLPLSRVQISPLRTAAGYFARFF